MNIGVVRLTSGLIRRCHLSLTAWRGVSFRTNDDRRPSKFIVLVDNMKYAINMAWEHGGPDFQSRFDKSTAQAQEMKEGVLRAFCEAKHYSLLDRRARVEIIESLCLPGRFWSGNICD